jgi:aspartyl-tRNA(Asn)/glutamyl-tRNA(Gln) amidotransferase subunit A
MSLLDLSASQLIQQMEAGELSAVEICEAYCDRIESHDGSIGAFLHADKGGAMQIADSVDHRRELGQPVGPLAGLPIAIKDILCARGGATTCGSKMLEEFIPPYDSTVVAKLKDADAVLVGRTNMDEFAMGGSTENSALGETRNPWDTDRVPGGSSGGSAACVAAKMSLASIGTDTGGSIRQPAAFCGVVGLKPTYGRVSRFGLVAFASSLDQVGPMTRSVEDAALLMDVIAGHDRRDSTSAPIDVPSYLQNVSRPLDGLRLGVVREHFGEGLDTEVDASVREAIKVYEGLGATVTDVSMPHSKYGIATYYIIAPSEASSNLARYDGVHYGRRTDESRMRDLLQEEHALRKKAGESTASIDSPLVRMYRQNRSEAFGPEVKRRIMLGTYALSAGYYDAYYLKALKVRRLIRQDYDEAFQQVDFLVGPVTPTTAFETGKLVNDPLAMYLGDLYTVTSNLAGVAALSLPCGFDQRGLPIGLQLQAKPFDENRLLRAAHMFQVATDWHQRSPELS